MGAACGAETDIATTAREEMVNDSWICERVG